MKRQILKVLNFGAVAVFMCTAADAQQDAGGGGGKLRLEFEHNALFAEPETTEDFRYMRLRIRDPNDQTVLDEVSLGELTAWYAPDDAATGVYDYEVFISYDAEDNGFRAETAGEVSTHLWRQSGSFELLDGSLTPLEDALSEAGDPGPADKNFQSHTTAAAETAGYSLQAVQTFSDDISITHDNEPSLILNNNWNIGGGEWRIKANGLGNFQISNWDTLQTPLLLLDGTTNSSSVLVQGNGDVDISNQKFRFDKSSISLGIGTTTPEQELHIVGSGTGGNPAIRMEETTEGYEWQLSANEGAFAIGDITAGTSPILIEKTAPTASFWLRENGDLGLGTSTPARQLHLRGDNAVFRMDRSAGSSAFLLVRTDGSWNPLKSFVVGVDGFSPGNGEFVINDLGTAVSGAGSRRMTIQNSGDVAFTGSVSAVAFNPTSSIRYKEHVEPIANPLALAQQLRGVRFDWKESGKSGLGFIAEDVEKVLPEVVAYDPNSGDVRGLNYDAIVPLLLEALKAQQAQIKVLEARLDDVEAHAAAGRPEAVLTSN